MIDFKLNFVNGGAQMAYEWGDSLPNNIWLSIHIKKGSFVFAPQLGSRLCLLKKVTSDTVKLARDYVLEALAWLVNAGRVTNLDCITEQDGDNTRINIEVSATAANGQAIAFHTFYGVV